MKIHTLKTIGHYFDAVVSGEKTFEVRRNDRAFQRGDILELRRMTDEFPNIYASPPGRAFKYVKIRKVITYVLQGGQFGIEPGYCVMGLGDCPHDGLIERGANA